MTASQDLIAPPEPASVLANYSKEKLDIIRNHVASPDFTDNELAYCLSVARNLDLDPLARQVYFTKRRQWVGKNKPGADREGFSFKVAAEPTIDGFRVMADRTGEMGGYDDPVWCGPDGVWVDVWLQKEPPAAARVRVYRKGREHSYSAIARFDEYVQKKHDGGINSMWLKMPANQLAKCAEALALRKAFPKQFNGVYSHEEMGQAENTSFSSLPKETKPEVIDAPPTNVRQIGASTTAKKAPKWDASQAIPSVVLTAPPKPVQALAGIALTKMAEDDLELVIEQSKQLYPKWEKMPGVVPKALKLLQEITIQSELQLRKFRGEVDPPPNDAPMDADSQPLPNFDPETGEVLS